MSIANFFRKLFGRKVVETVKKALWLVSCTFVRSVATKVLNDPRLQELALKAVQTAATFDVDNRAKFNVAVKTFVNYVEAEYGTAFYNGIPSSVIDALVQTAYTMWHNAEENADG